MVEGWLIVEVGFFEVSLGNHRSDGYFCASTLLLLHNNIFSPYPQGSIQSVVPCQSGRKYQYLAPWLSSQYQ